MKTNTEEKEMTAIEKIGMIEENKNLRDRVQYLETWKDNAKKTLKIYDDMGDTAPLTLLMDSLAEYFLHINRGIIPPGISRESEIGLKLVLAEAINDTAQGELKRYFNIK